MAGQGQRRVRDCIRRRGWEFRVDPVVKLGTKWCRHCDYRVDLHEKIVKEGTVEGTR